MASAGHPGARLRPRRRCRRANRNLFTAGFVETNSGVYALLDQITNVLAQYLDDQHHRPSRAAKFDAMIATDRPDLSGGIGFINPGYTASKFGLRGFLLGLATRAPATGVPVTIVNPGGVDTPMLRHEAATGGSALNFLGTPLEPAAVADAVVGCIGRKRLEVNLPRSDGWMIKAAMLVPGLAVRLLPRIARLGRANLDRYRRRYLE